jgi:hypothetical protein
MDCDEPVVYLRGTATFEMMVDGLAALEEIAREVASPRRRGRPPGTGILPEPIISALTRVYEKATGLKAGAGEGPFSKFVSAFAKAVQRSVLRVVRPRHGNRRRGKNNSGALGVFILPTRTRLLDVSVLNVGRGHSRHKPGGEHLA